MKKTAVLMLIGMWVLRVFPDTLTPEGWSVRGFITGFPKDKPVFCALYSSVERIKVKDFDAGLRFFPPHENPDTIHYEFNGIASGRYVLAVFVDMNNDSVLNMGLLGPTEPWQFYHSASGMLMPCFEKCSFVLDRHLYNADVLEFRGMRKRW